MRPLAEAPVERLRRVSLVLTDMDDTLTHRGRLPAATYAALERLETAGIPVIPVTAAPAGWCDQMARMWPVAGVIGESTVAEHLDDLPVAPAWITRGPGGEGFVEAADAVLTTRLETTG